MLLSLAFSYVPGLRDKFDALDPTYKRLIMLALLLVVAAALYGLACAGVVEFANGATCDRAGLVELARAFLAAMMANQAAYLLTPRKPSGPYYSIKNMAGNEPDEHNNFGIA